MLKTEQDIQETTSLPNPLHLLHSTNIYCYQLLCAGCWSSLRHDGSHDTTKQHKKNQNKRRAVNQQLWFNRVRILQHLKQNENSSAAAAFCSIKQAAMSKTTTKLHKTIYISWYTIAFFSQQSFISWQCAQTKQNDIKHVSHDFITIHLKSHRSSEVRINTKQQTLKSNKSYVPIYVFFTDTVLWILPSFCTRTVSYCCAIKILPYYLFTF